MLFHSRFPERYLWVSIEEDHVREGLCTHEGLPGRLFCGRPAVSVTRTGPRCHEHRRATDQLAYAYVPLC